MKQNSNVHNGFIRILSVLLYISVAHASPAQIVVKGTVYETNKQILPYTRVVLTDSTAATTLSFDYTDNNGQYKLTTNSEGPFTLQFSSLGFRDSIVYLSANTDSALQYDIILKEKRFELNEVIVEATKPIIVKKDTIIFDAASFANGNEQVVEDLLRKIPGLKIDDEGTITVGSKEVEKVMIEGDDFFEKGYKIVTKNMPAQPIDKVELLQNYSDNRLLKGIEESDKVALNLKLNEDAKSQLFATVNGGYGIKNKHSLTTNIFNFGKKNKYYLISNLNNIGYESAGEINHLVNPYRPDDLTVIGDNESAAELIQQSIIDLDFKKSRTDINNDKLFSSNAILNPSKKVKIKALGFLLDDRKNFFQNTSEEFNANKTDFVNSQKNDWKLKNLEVFGRLNLEYDNQKNQKLEISSSYNHANDQSNNSFSFNDTDIKEKLNTYNNRFDNQFSHVNKLTDHQVLIIKGRSLYETREEEYSVNQFFFFELFPDESNAESVKQENQTVLNYGALEGHYMDRKKNKDLFEILTGNEFKSQRLYSSFSILSSEPDQSSQPEEAQNDFTYLTNASYALAKYSKRLGETTLIFKTEYKLLFNRINSLQNSEYEIAHLINPSIGIKWKPNDKHQLICNYSYNTSNAGLLDVYESFVLTGFRSFSRGTGSFSQLTGSSGLINYQFGGWTDNFLISSTIFYNRSHDFFSYQTQLRQNYSLAQKILFKDRDLMNGSLSIDRYLPFVSSNLKLTGNYSITNYQNVVNEIFREVKSKNYSIGFELRSAFTGPLNYHIGSKIQEFDVQTNFRNSYSNNMSFVDLLFRINKNSILQLQTERYYFGNIGDDNEYYFLDIDWRYVIIPNKLTVNLSGKNLFNTNTFKTASLTDVSFMVTQYQLLPRFVLLSAEIRL